MSTILIVADDAALTSVIAGTLTISGYEVFGASSGKEALRKVSKRRFDLILIDLALDGELGSREVLMTTRMLPNGAGTPVIAIADDADLSGDLAEIRGEVVDHLVKPILPRALEDAVARVILEAEPLDVIRLEQAEVYEALGDLVREARESEQI